MIWYVESQETPMISSSWYEWKGLKVEIVCKAQRSVVCIAPK